jgi:hypothetical protein
MPMTKKTIIWFMVILSVCVLTLALAFELLLRSQDAQNAARVQQQERLARQLGVRIKDYPAPDVFPDGYFETVLQPGMTLEQVHAIVRGYASVHHCFKDEELYYYFSKNDDGYPIRFELWYDDQGRFIDLRSEDPNEPVLGLGPACIEGLLGQ